LASFAGAGQNKGGKAAKQQARRRPVLCFAAPLFMIAAGGD